MIYTCYSYKGGVGRSMALANLGTYFFKNGYTTLMVDMDLEAPGLERYFQHEPYRLDVSAVCALSGFCDMIQQYKTNVAQPAREEDEQLPYPPIEQYIHPICSEGQAKLLLMHAGRRMEGKPWQDYASFVQTFDWTEFYDQWEGGMYLEWLRDELKRVADVVLIDSRTGFTEMGGVATQHLADAVVMFCGANLENMENTARMMRAFAGDSVLEARRGRKLDVMVVPSRIDDADSGGFSSYLARLETTFSGAPIRALADGYSMQEMLIPYLAAFSYSEMLVIDNPELISARRLITAYHRIASNLQTLAPEDSPLRKPQPVRDSSGRVSVYLAFSYEDQTAGLRVAESLVKHGASLTTVNYSGTDQREDQDPAERVARADAIRRTCNHRDASGHVDAKTDSRGRRPQQTHYSRFARRHELANGASESRSD